VLQPISRFQAAVIGDDIYLHTHRNTANILRLSKVDNGMLRCVHCLCSVVITKLHREHQLRLSNMQRIHLV
jgi:hypothetical protein